MSDLQIVLIALGVLIIAGVIVYNWMQEKKLRSNIADDFIVPQKDVLAEDFYIDTDAFVDKTLGDMPNKIKITEKLNEPITPPPSADAPSAPVETEAQTSTEIDSIAPAQTEAQRSKPIDDAPKKATQPAEDNAFATSPLPDDIHSQIDLTAFLYATKAIQVDTLRTFAGNIADDMGVPMMMHGQDAEGKWHVIKHSSPNDAYKQIACSIQLADRSGPISKHVLNKFQFAVEEMGLELNAHVEWQGSGDASQRAIDLDKFCIEVDQLVSVHLMQGETAIHGTKFKGLAEANNMKLSADGKFCFYDNNHAEIPIFILIGADHQPFTAEGLRTNVVKAATFQIEIPKVGNCEQVFTQMIAVAQKMANSLGARMVDDNQKPLGDLQIEKIRQQLKVIHATMVARGVMPGSAGSMRLFN